MKLKVSTKKETISRWQYLIIGCLLLVSVSSYGQSFTLKSGTPFPVLIKTTTTFADVDGDGDLDVLITGEAPALTTKLYTNDGSGGFTEKVNSFTAVTQGAVAFADIDGDNDQDVLITGISSSGASTKLYTNDGTGTFTEVVGTPFDNVSQSSVAFADIDGDNDQDVLITGSNIAKLYTNNGSGAFTLVAGTPFTGVNFSSMAFTDVDGDNDQDVLITGSHTSKLYTNNGTGTFTLVAGTPFVNVSEGSIAFADVDGDNDQDVIITGSDATAQYHSKLYTNNGTGTFTVVAGTPFLPVRSSSVEFVDIDGDTDKDVLIIGDIGSLQYRTRLYTNNGSGTFTSVSTVLTDAAQGSIAFGDVDNDSDQDLIIMGRKISGTVGNIAELYLNNNSPFQVSLNPSAVCSNGGPFSLPVILDKDVDLGAISFKLDYDETLLSYTGYASTSYTTLNESTNATPGVGQINNVNGELIFSWYAPNNTTGIINYTANSVLLELEFSIINTTTAASPAFAWSTTLGDCELADNLSNVITATFNNVTGTINAPSTATLTSNPANATICVGDNITFTGGGAGSTGSGNALNFHGVNANGTGQNLVSGANANLPTGNAARTIEAWIRTNNVSGGDEAIFEYGTIVNGQRSSLLINNNNVVSHNGFNADVNGTTSVRDGSWHHIAITHDGTTTKVYVDGVLDVSQAITYNTTGTNFAIGGTPVNHLHYDGDIDEVRVWNYARTVTEISNNKDNELTGSESGLVAYYNFNLGVAGGNNTAITTVPDLSSSNANGTISNTFLLNGSFSNFVAGTTGIPASSGTYQFFVNNASQGAASTTSTFSSTSLANNDVVKVTITDANGCTSDASVTVTVNPLPTVTLASDDSDNRICLGSSITFTATSATASSYFFFNAAAPSTQLTSGAPLNKYTTTTLANNDVINVEVTDGNGCKNTSTAITTAVIDCYEYSGELVYKNTNETKMGNVTITFTSQNGYGNHTVTTTADNVNNGAFSVANLFANETYNVTYSTNKAFGGVNTTDAFRTLLNSVNLFTLSGLNLTVADVDASTNVTAADALSIQLRFLQAINNYPNSVPDWGWGTTSVSLTGDLTNQKLYALTYGDVNGSYVPNETNSGNQTVFLVDGDNMNISDGETVTIPIKLKNAATLGAVSLALNYPTLGMTINNVTMPNGQSVLYNDLNGELRMSWTDLATMNMTDDEILFNIEATIVDANEVVNHPMTVGLVSEISDASASPFNYIELSSPIFTTTITSTNAIEADAFNVQSFPNPFRTATAIQYTLPSKSKVSIIITNSLGQEVRTLVHEEQSAGNQQVMFHANDLNAGVYFYTIRVDDGEHVQSITNSIVLLK